MSFKSSLLLVHLKHWLLPCLLVATFSCTKDSSQNTLELMPPTTSAKSVEALGSVTLSAPLKTAGIDAQSLSYEWLQILPQVPQGTFSAVNGASKKEQINWMAPEITEATSFVFQVIAQSQDGKTSNAAIVSVVVNPHEAACKGSCSDPANAICVDQNCAPCKSDDECADWADRRRNDRKLCINRVCRECRSATDCKDSSKPSCEDKSPSSPTANLCFACKQDSDCPGTQLCKKDEAMSDKPANIGACVQESEIVYVNNAAGCDASGVGTSTTPFCQVTEAVAKGGKPYIRVAGSATAYNKTTITQSGARFIIIGSGRDAAPPSIIAGVVAGDSARVTLSGVQMTTGSIGSAVTCQNSAAVYLRDVLMKKSIVGIEANCSLLWMENSLIPSASESGIHVYGSTQYRIVNNIIMWGGTATAPHGVDLDGTSNGYFAFNTVVKNMAGIHCSNSQRISDSIVSNNTAPSQVDGSCVQVRIATNLTEMEVKAGTKINPLEPTISNEASWVDQASAADVEAERLLKNSPQHAPVTDDYHHTPRPKGSAYDLGHKELK